ncbi:MAG: pyridoxal phosphate-dependent aminotransferase [Acidimicrobiales bacterium]
MGFDPPPYPYDRLAPLAEAAGRHQGGAVDLSIGTPYDAPPAVVAAALADPAAARSYPPSIGTPSYRAAAAGWLARRFGIAAEAADVAACVGTKEVVAGLPQWLRLRTPERDTVLYPEISYPTYAMGATLAGCRAVPVPVDDDWCLRLDAIDADDAARALCLWVNAPGNLAGGLDDLGAAAAWGRERQIPVLSDECYAEFTWSGPPRSILQHGLDGVLAVHSLSKRSNLAGARAGFYAGDADLVRYLSEVRKHAGLMVPGPVQAAGAAAWSDDEHVERQRAIYRERLEVLVDGLRAVGLDAHLPGGAFYLWLAAGRRCLGARRSPRRAGRDARQPRRVLRPAVPGTCASRRSPRSTGCGRIDRLRR